MSLLRAPTEIFCPLLVPVSVSLGSPQITGPPAVCSSFYHALGLYPHCSLDEPPSGPTEIFTRFSFHCLRVLGIASDHGESGDTPQENTDSSATESGPSNEDREQWPLDGTLHPDTLTRAATSSADSSFRFWIWASFEPHRDLLPASRSTVSMSLGSASRSTIRRHPHKKILILLQHVSAPCREGTGSSGRLMELCPDTLTRAAYLFCQTAESGDTRQENTDSSATVSAPCERGDRGSGSLMGLCTLTPSRVRFTSSADSRVDPETPHKKILILLQHVSAPMPAGDREQWPQWNPAPWPPLRVRFHLFCRQPTGHLAEAGTGQPTKMPLNEPPLLDSHDRIE
ncbi:Sarcoplasmic/Endoplasmic Reticulum Calcium Atpase 1 [Manis pentadactyla]|nr:Sarcoplasmic/Endoplasmic Reticulum Calcium Atpase 1 [Manis pentadactyla]